MDIEEEQLKCFVNEEGEVVRKTVFLIIYTGGRANIIKNKLNRACNAFNATKYNIPKN